MLTKATAQGVIDRVLALAKTGGGQALVSLRGRTGGNTRFAVNEITSSSQIETAALAVTVQFGKRAATATTNQLDDRSIEDVVSRAQRIAKLSPENPETMPPLGAQKYRSVRAPVDQATIDHTPAARAKAVAAALGVADKAKVQIAGFYEHATHAWALGSTSGLWAFHQWTRADLSCTARTTDGTGSGWAGAESNKVGDLDAGRLAKTAADKAVASQKPKALAPGKYTVVLEPEAVANLLGALRGRLDARRADEGRSFFANKRIGDKLFPDLVTLRTDPTDGALSPTPFDGEGVPLVPTTWIDKGKLAALTYGRYWAHKQSKQPTGSPAGWTLDPGVASRDELIKGVKKGVLITRFWYIRSLDPQTILMTGLTRDGTFLIEDGKVTAPVVNFRFNESPVQMLARCDGLTPAVLTGGMRVPGLRTHDFNLASVSEAV